MLSGPFVGSKLHPRGSLRQQVKVPGSQHPSAAGFKGTRRRNQAADVTRVHQGQAALVSAAGCRAAGKRRQVFGLWGKLFGPVGARL